jgi:hypothetical protein
MDHGHSSSRSPWGLRAALLALVAGLVLGVAGPASALPHPANDPFYAYSGTTPLGQLAPGTVLQTRKVPYHLAGLKTPIKVIQIAYRTTNQQGFPAVNVTSVLLPPLRVGAPKVIAYQSFYDSLSANDEPSYAISGGMTLGGSVTAVETGVVLPFLLQGYTIAIDDTEGQQADFAAGPEYGMNTLDGLRAAFAAPSVGLKNTTKVGMIGYSGGAIATEWAAELAPSYAPDVNAHLVGAALGGVLVDPAHNLHYIDGSTIWAGVAPMAIIGVARAFGIPLDPYLSAYGAKVVRRMEHASIAAVLGEYPGLTWTQVAKPQYPTPEDVPFYVNVVNRLIMGTGGTPSIPLYIGQGADGELEGTSGSTPGIGKGDGVMITGDVRSLARQYCAEGTPVLYKQYDNASHTGTAALWLPTAGTWLLKRFAGAVAPQNCSTIAPGNSLAPLPPYSN